MKKVLLSLLPCISVAQVGIGTNEPHQETLLDIKTETNDKAIGLPIVSLNSIIDNSVNPIKDPQKGFLVYNTNENLEQDGVVYGQGLFFHDGIEWQSISFSKKDELSEAYVKNIRLEDPNGSYPLFITNYTETIDNIEGGSFDELSGVFTAPKDYIYEINYSASLLALSHCLISINVNGIEVGNVIAIADVDLQSKSSTLALDLKQGDKVTVSVNPLISSGLNDKPITIQELKLQIRLQQL